MKGRVKFINEEKGYGFIKSPESPKDIFVHSSGLIDEICEQLVNDIFNKAVINW